VPQGFPTGLEAAPRQPGIWLLLAVLAVIRGEEERREEDGKPLKAAAVKLVKQT